MVLTNYAIAQNLEQLGKAKVFNLTGGVAASAVYHAGDSNREPFTYFLSGNINLNISNVYNIPFTFTYSNLKFESSNPFSFNRLSIHPSYKWVTTHIGDVNMSFSPYTLNGHQFTGLGVDLTPERKWRVSAMYGRLLKASEFNADDPQSLPAYDRFGYGIKLGYSFDKLVLGGIFFKAKDEESSLQNPTPIELEIQPRDNVVLSLESKLKLFEKGEITAEVAVSTLTENTSATGEVPENIVFAGLLDANATTNQYKAYNLGFSYALGQGAVGINYEYIDPEYRTLGAYFFNNDLENITVNASQTILDNKVNIAVNGGVQRDDLDNTKSSELQRFVSAVNIAYTASEKLNVTVGYSNFQSFTNIKDQFDRINEVAFTDNLDTLNFRQISQNTNLNINYALKDTETKKQQLGFVLTYQNADNQQDGNTVENGESQLYNGNVSYGISYPKKHLNVTSSVNMSYNTLGSETSTIYGPIVSVNKQFFDKKLNSNASVSYNNSISNGEVQNQITNVRVRNTYSYKKKHNFNLNLLSQFRSGTNSTQNFTATFGYNYVFDKFKPNINFGERKKKVKQPKVKKTSTKDIVVQFKYKDSLYSGTLPQVNIQLQRIQNHSKFDYIPTYKKGELAVLRQDVSKEKDAKLYKEKALEFLKQLYSYETFLENYEALIYETLLELQIEMNQLDYAYENAYVEAIVKVNGDALNKLSDVERNQAPQEQQNTYNANVKKADKALKRLISHRWMLDYVMAYKTLEDVKNPDPYLAEILDVEKINIFRKWDKNESTQHIQLYIITRVIDFYIKKSEDKTDPEDFELKYIEKK